MYLYDLSVTGGHTPVLKSSFLFVSDLYNPRSPIVRDATSAERQLLNSYSTQESTKSQIIYSPSQPNSKLNSPSQLNSPGQFILHIESE